MLDYLISTDYGHGRDYVCIIIAEKRRGVLHVIGEGWHLKSEKLAREIAIMTIKPWWKRWLIRWRERGQHWEQTGRSE